MHRRTTRMMRPVHGRIILLKQLQGNSPFAVQNDDAVARFTLEQHPLVHSERCGHRLGCCAVMALFLDPIEDLSDRRSLINKVQTRLAAFIGSMGADGGSSRLNLRARATCGL